MATRKPRICVYAISKNEEQFVGRFIRSAADADFVLIADTGSTDGTVDFAEVECDAVYSILINPWRFDHARNAALALVPKDIDICVSLDLDEVLEPGWREEIERVWKPDTTRMRYMYDWGNGVRFKYEKIHARNGYHWHHPCHEYPRPDGRIKEVWAETDRLLVRHLPDPEKSRGQYLDLLELSVKEDPSCPRNAFYYGRELFFWRRWQEAVDALMRYLAMPEAVWHVERSYAMRVLCECFEEIGDLPKAEKWGRAATAEDPWAREPWCVLAKFYYRLGAWPDCYAASMRALAVTERQLVYSSDPEVWGALPHDLAAISAWRMGLKGEAIKHGEMAVELAPDDERLITNLAWFRGEKG